MVESPEGFGLFAVGLFGEVAIDEGEGRVGLVEGENGFYDVGFDEYVSGVYDEA